MTDTPADAVARVLEVVDQCVGDLPDDERLCNAAGDAHSIGLLFEPKRYLTVGDIRTLAAALAAREREVAESRRAAGGLELVQEADPLTLADIIATPGKGDWIMKGVGDELAELVNLNHNLRARLAAAEARVIRLALDFNRVNARLVAAEEVFEAALRAALAPEVPRG